MFRAEDHLCFELNTQALRWAFWYGNALLLTIGTVLFGVFVSRHDAAGISGLVVFYLVATGGLSAFAFLAPLERKWLKADLRTNQLPRMSRLYDTDRVLPSPEMPIQLSRAIALCHKALFCAVATIGRSHPEDAAPITRRAVEIASTTFAVMHDATNLDRWIAEEQRMARWRARTKGAKPRSFSPRLQVSPRHETSEKLQAWLGILSDAAVHYTPEYLSTQQISRHRDTADPAIVELRLSFHESDVSAVERALAVALRVHLLILYSFDEALGGALSANAE